MKVGKRKEKNSSDSWLLTGTYHKNLVVWNFFPSKFGKVGPFFVP
jgi:hypothetical protein